MVWILWWLKAHLVPRRLDKGRLRWCYKRHAPLQVTKSYGGSLNSGWILMGKWKSSLLVTGIQHRRLWTTEIGMRRIGSKLRISLDGSTQQIRKCHGSSSFVHFIRASCCDNNVTRAQDLEPRDMLFRDDALPKGWRKGEQNRQESQVFSGLAHNTLAHNQSGYGRRPR